MKSNISIGRDEESGITTIEAEGTKIKLHIYHFNDSAKIEDHSGGSAIYFQSMEEVRQLRSMLDALMVENPVIKPRH